MILKKERINLLFIHKNNGYIYHNHKQYICKKVEIKYI